MSYSFIKSVFPDFSHSTQLQNRVYDDSHLGNNDYPVRFGANPPVARNQPLGGRHDLAAFRKSLKPGVSTPTYYGAPGKIHTPKVTIEPKSRAPNAEGFASVGDIKAPGGDNLHFYNLPAPNEFLAPYQNYDQLDHFKKHDEPAEPVTHWNYGGVSSQFGPRQVAHQTGVTGIEPFQNRKEEKKDCDANIKAVLDCPKCKAKIVKRLGLGGVGGSRQQEFMELLSYILLGIFILMLLDRK